MKPPPGGPGSSNDGAAAGDADRDQRDPGDIVRRHRVHRCRGGRCTGPPAQRPRPRRCTRPGRTGWRPRIRLAVVENAVGRRDSLRNRILICRNGFEQANPVRGGVRHVHPADGPRFVLALLARGHRHVGDPVPPDLPVIVGQRIAVGRRVARARHRDDEGVGTVRAVVVGMDSIGVGLPLSAPPVPALPESGAARALAGTHTARSTAAATALRAGSLIVGTSNLPR